MQHAIRCSAHSAETHDLDELVRHVAGSGNAPTDFHRLKIRASERSPVRVRFCTRARGSTGVCARARRRYFGQAQPHREHCVI
jgi:hypothetical protein